MDMYKTEKFDPQGDPNERSLRWVQWKRNFQFALNASKVKNETRRYNELLFRVGIETQELFLDRKQQLINSDGYDDIAGETDYGKAINILDEIFIRKNNASSQRMLFHHMKQEEGEGIVKFVARLRMRATFCEFETIKEMEKAIKDQILEHGTNKKLRQEMWKKDRTLDEMIELAQSIENVKYCEEQHQMRNEIGEKSVVGSVQTKRFKSNFGGNNQRSDKCWNCDQLGHMRFSAECPAKTLKCGKCQRIGHIAKCCRIGQRPPMQRSQQRGNFSQARRQTWKPKGRTFVNAVDCELKSEDDVETEYIFSVTSSHAKEIECCVGGVTIKMVIDSGCHRNLITNKVWEEMKEKKVAVIQQKTGSDVNLKAYGDNNIIPVKGRFQANLKLNGIEKPQWFYVVLTGDTCLLGEATSKEHGVLKIGIGTTEVNNITPFPAIEGVLIDIAIDPSVQPVSQPLRRIPIHQMETVKAKLDALQRANIISPVDKPSRWVSPMVIVNKADGQIRICIDMRMANRAIIRQKHPLPMLEELWALLCGATVFSVLDIKDAFHQLKLAPNSKDITTFITPWGLMKYERLMFGICNAPELFQRQLEIILIGLSGVINYLDDILVYGRSEKEHNENLKNVLARLEGKKVLLNQEKAIIGKNEVKFVGHMISKNGVKPCTDKMEAIKNFRQPKTTEELRSFLGLITYLGRFLKNLASMSDPLRELNKGRKIFEWNEDREKCFRELKNLITNNLRLSFFDVKKQSVLVVDASPVGVGLVLKQVDENLNEFIIMFASKSLTDTERRYSQTEKEGLAIVWGIERCKIYLLGCSFTLITDHRPLLYMFRPGAKNGARIERYVLRLQAYDFEVIHEPGKGNIADPLSRLSIKGNGDSLDFDEETEIYVHSIIESTNMTAMTLEEIKEANKTDKVYEDFKRGLDTGMWIDAIKSFQNEANQFCIINGLLLKFHRIYIPEKSRDKILQLAHEGHPGIEKTLNRLRERAWWPKMKEDVKKICIQCRPCLQVSRPNPPVPMKMRELPKGPWRDLNIDFKDVPESKKEILVVVDSYTRYVELKIQNSTKANETLKNLDEIFNTYGYPDSITSDNGPPYNSIEYSDYCEARGIKTFFSIPLYGQGNGVVERVMQGVKKSLQTSKISNGNWEKDLLTDFLTMSRNTPHTVTGKSPADLMFTYKRRDKLPIFKPPVENDEIIREKNRKYKEKSKQKEDIKRRAKESDIKVGDKVLISNNNLSKSKPNFNDEEFTVVSRKEGDCEVMDTHSGVRRRRHITMLKKIPDVPSSSSSLSSAELHPEETNKKLKLSSNISFQDKQRVSNRVRVPPAKLQDYVRNIED